MVVTNTSAAIYKVLINHKNTLVNADGDPDGQELSVIMSGIIPFNIDPNVEFGFTTNGFPRFEIMDFLGSVYELSKTDNLVYTEWAGVPESPLAVMCIPTEWVDVSTNSVQFYKVEKTE